MGFYEWKMGPEQGGVLCFPPCLGQCGTLMVAANSVIIAVITL